jgi:[ribosomal protein S5]-alanine N-acetyltransferase
MAWHRARPALAFGRFAPVVPGSMSTRANELQVGPKLMRHGPLAAAARAMLAYANSSMAVVRLQAPVFAWNPASMRVLEKVGFHREAVHRKSVFKDGELIDSVMYAHIRDDA